MRICVSDAGPLTPEHDAGSRAVTDVITVLRDLGYAVDYRLPGEINDLSRYDIFIASRPGPALHALQLPGFSRIRSVYFGHDLHFARMASSAPPRHVEATRRAEQICWRSYDRSVYPSAEEAAVVNEALEEQRATALPIYVFPVSEVQEKSDDPTCIFVGSRAHAPNAAAVELLLTTIWPRMRAQLDATLHLVGDWGDVVPVDGADSVRLHPWLPDRDLDDLVAQCWLSLAPLLFGAGVKRKVVHSLAQGTPVVGTSVAFQGVGDGSSAVGGFVANSADALSAAAVRLLGDTDDRRALAQAGQSYCERTYSPRVVAQAWQGFCETLGGHGDEQPSDREGSAT